MGFQLVDLWCISFRVVRLNVSSAASSDESSLWLIYLLLLSFAGSVLRLLLLYCKELWLFQDEDDCISWMEYLIPSRSEQSSQRAQWQTWVGFSKKKWRPYYSENQRRCPHRQYRFAETKSKCVTRRERQSPAAFGRTSIVLWKERSNTEVRRPIYIRRRICWDSCNCSR